METSIRSKQSKQEDAPAVLSDRGWRALALNGLAFLVVVNGALAFHAYRQVGDLRAELEKSLGRTEQRYQSLDSQVSFASERRRLILGIRDEILKTRPELGTSGAYDLASLVVDASDRFPGVDPLLLVSIGIVKSRYNLNAVSDAGARGLYQLHASTGRLLARALGWEYSDDLLHDPAKSTEMAACYLDLLQTTYNDVGMVLAEYNGGPLNAGYFRAQVRALSSETRDFVPRVLGVHERLAQELGAERGDKRAPVLLSAVDEESEPVANTAGPALSVTSAASGQ